MNEIALSDLTNNIIGGIAAGFFFGIVAAVILCAVAACMYRR